MQFGPPAFKRIRALLQQLVITDHRETGERVELQQMLRRHAILGEPIANGAARGREQVPPN